jgi:hypothetical protein
MSITWDLESAQRLIEGVVQQLEEAPEKAAIVKLIAACESLDRHYKKACEEVDLDYGDPIGTAYEDGFNMEYCIEGDWWQEISEALRELRKDA